ncbi:FecCD family ABC transporter permease [Streptomyces acidicola]|uniref:FecCD family ABC transporter permease n=1 Tax=Streptomyces acidicola TaxID=2596892 RepID=UPI003818E2DD
MAAWVDGTGRGGAGQGGGAGESWGTRKGVALAWSARPAWLVLALALTLLTVVLSLSVGTRPVPLAGVLDSLLHGGSSPDALVVRSLRVPRTVVGLAAGAALGLAGAALQAVTRNPLADPGILGLSQGAAAGVVLAIAFGLGHGFAGYAWYAFAGAVVAACVVYTIASRGRGGASPVKLALAGTAFAAMTTGANTVVLTSSSATLDQFRFWQVGALSGRDAGTVGRMLPFLVVGALLVLVCARGLDALALGDDTARALGHRVQLVRATAALGATLLTAAAVAAAGPIAFIGLAVPHLARRLVAGGHRWVLPLSALLGAALLLAADVAGRVVRAPAEVPAGVMTALVGVPVLVVLVRRKKVTE